MSLDRKEKEIFLIGETNCDPWVNGNANTKRPKQVDSELQVELLIKTCTKGAINPTNNDTKTIPGMQISYFSTSNARYICKTHVLVEMGVVNRYFIYRIRKIYAYKIKNTSYIVEDSQILEYEKAS